MSEHAGMRETTTASADEQRIARGLSIGLPIVTIVAGAIVGVVMTPATSILVLAAGLLLGVIAILWTSLRTLTGDAPLSPEFEALEMSQHGGDALSDRRTMLLRALKDLENERALGKIELDDYEQLSQSYRHELKIEMKRLDDVLEPHRAKAEELAKRHLQEVGLGEEKPALAPSKASSPNSQPLEDVLAGKKPPQDSHAATSLAHESLEGRASASLELPQSSTERRSTNSSPPEKGSTEAAPERVACRECGASNEADAKFCKECATKLTSASVSPQASSPVVEGSQ